MIPFIYRCAIYDHSGRCWHAFKENLNKLIPVMVRQAHHERNQQAIVRPEPVEGPKRRSLEAILNKVEIGVTTKTPRSIAILIFVLMLGHIVQTSAGEIMKLSENDAGKTIEICVGDELEIGLPGNPTTGYVWEASLLDSNLLSQSKADFYANDKAIGAGGMEIIKLYAFAEGKTEVKFIYHRPFERDKPPLKTFAATIVIRK